MKKLLLALVIFLGLIIVPLAGLAEPDTTLSCANCTGLVPCGCNDNCPCEPCHLFALVNNIIDKVIKGIVPLIAAVLIAYAGFKMLTNQGNADVTNQVKQIIFGTIIGLVVVYTSYALVGLMLSSMGYVRYGNSPVAAWDWAPKCE